MIDKLPESIDYIADFVGRPESDSEKFIEINHRPAQVMKKIATEKNVKSMGFIGGKIGPKFFLQGKKEIADSLSQGDILVAVVEPTVVYGADRDDAMNKMIPLFKLFGIFISNMKPVRVEDVAKELIEKMKSGGSN